MPLHVNLYHEVQRQEMARRRDPLRIGMLAIMLFAVGFLANYFVVLERTHYIHVKYTGLQAEWAKIQPQAKTAKDRQDKLNAEIAASDAMMKNVDSRFFWAPVLDNVLRAVPRTVQVTHVGAEMPSGDKATDGVVSISGIASATEPRKEAEVVRTALNSSLGSKYKRVSSVFKSLEDSDQFVMLDGHRLATASFTMEFQIQIREPVVVEAPAPPARKPKASSESAE